MVNILLKVLPYKDISWHDIGETFYRFQLAKTKWFNVYLHYLIAPNEHPQCHDHPWNFLAIILFGGYTEFRNGKWSWKRPGSILYRPATTQHNVVTFGANWSIVITGPKIREWGLV